MFNITTKLIIFFLISFSNVHASCFGNIINSDISKIEFVEIENKNKFFSTIGKFYLIKKKDSSKNLKKNKLKKKYNALIKVNYKNGAYCTYESKIRFHGDFESHIDFINGTPVPSLRVKLKDGHIKNITKFILFRPGSRYFDSEIFSSVLYKQLGFLSPRTFKVKVKINGIDTEYLFQENLKKEFLEFNSRLEGPILESNEDYYNIEIFQLAKISNAEWIKEDYINKLTSLEAIRFYNKILLSSKNFFNYDKLIRFNSEDFDKISYKNLSEFDALTYATGNTHGLTFYNRRFYYDPIKKILEPIYYDGCSKILSEINYDIFTGEYKKRLFNYQKTPKLNFDRIQSDKLDQKYVPKKGYSKRMVTNSAKNGAKVVYDKLIKLDKKTILEELHKNGFKNIKLDQLEVIIQKILFRLDLIHKNKKDFETDYLGIENSSYKTIKTKKKINLLFLKNKNILNCLYKSSCDYTEEELLKVEVENCNQNLTNCQSEFYNNKNFRNLLEQNQITKKYDIFLSLDKNEYINGNIQEFKKDKQNLFGEKSPSEDIKIFHNSHVKIKYDEKLNKIKLIYDNSLGKVLISNSKLINTEIIMQNNNSKFDNYKKNYNLTGCLTILDSTLKNITIIGKNFYCEDTVNFIRTNGTIKEINVSNANSDAIDADFSKLQIKNIYVNNALNDCVDVSFGVYEVREVTVEKCGDKGISVGEMSKFNSENIFIKNSNTGLASKDGSIAKIKNFNSHSTQVCMSSYKKKQEFDGGYIKVENFKCEDYEKKISYDNFSKIKHLNN